MSLEVSGNFWGSIKGAKYHFALEDRTWDYSWQLQDQKKGNWEEIDKFLENYNLLKLNQEEIENLNRPITSKETSKEIETVIRNFPAKKKKKKKHSSRQLHI